MGWRGDYRVFTAYILEDRWHEPVVKTKPIVTTDPSSADPQKEPILVETTDASKTAEDVRLSISPHDVAKVFFLKFSIFIQFSPFI